MPAASASQPPVHQSSVQQPSAQPLSGQRQGDCLRLTGELTASHLLPLWSARQQLMQGISRIDISAVSRTDSAGLALLLHLARLAQQDKRQLTLQGASETLFRLVRLYNLPESLFRLADG